MMDESSSVEANGQRNGRNVALETELRTFESGVNEHQEHMSASNGIPKMAAEDNDKKNDTQHGKNHQDVKKTITRKKTRKEQSLESWASAEKDPFVCTGCGSGCRLCCWNGSLDSIGCPLASPQAVYDILVHSRRVLGAYGSDVDDLEKLIAEHERNFSKKIVVKFEHPSLGEQSCPPYFICVDDQRREVALYMRGLHLLHKDDYSELMNNRKKEQPFNGGYLHFGMGKAATWCLTNVAPYLKEQLLKNPGYRLTLVGHSLGAGVVSLLACLFVEDPDAVGGIDPDLIRAYAIAPPRVLSLNLATKYKTNIYSVVYQDDFLPRISTSAVKRVFVGALSLTGILFFLYWIKQHMKKPSLDSDSYRLYPPGLIFHIVYRQPGVWRDMPIQVRVVDSVIGRFERVILTSSGTAVDHSVLKMAVHLEKYDWPPELRAKIQNS